MSPDTMIRMANQIAAFFKTQPNVDAAVKTMEHMTDFWEPRMRQQLRDHVTAGGAGLDDAVIKAANMMS